jgi:hypothetical protein
VQHALLLTTGNLLKIRKAGTLPWHNVPLVVTHGQLDYVKATIHIPDVTGIMSFASNKALTMAHSVAPIDLLKQLKDHSILLLLHLRYGCAPQVMVLQAILKEHGIDMKVPNDFNCPICMAKKTV